MTKKRYSVWQREEKARYKGPDLETWIKAKGECDYMGKGFRVFRHNDDGTVTDVTDGETDEARWWCRWSPREGFDTQIASRQVTDGGSVRVHWAAGVVEYATAYIRSATAPTPEQFQAYVLAETGVTVPCVEEPRWWGWSSTTNEWKPAALKHSYVEVWNDARSCCIYGTVSNRDEKRDALFAATKAAGKPEDVEQEAADEQ